MGEFAAQKHPNCVIGRIQVEFSMAHLDLGNKGQRRQGTFASLQQKIFKTDTNQ